MAIKHLCKRGNVIIKPQFSLALDLEITDYVCFDILHVRSPIQSFQEIELKANETAIMQTLNESLYTDNHSLKLSPSNIWQNLCIFWILSHLCLM